ncbi:Fic family protein [Bacillus thuringiensis]|uniref:Fic family protein n=1 Tax=Bacillus thuringiensis TaxID=1428 RepID=UPI003CEDCDDD
MKNFFEDRYNNIEFEIIVMNLISEISEYNGKLTAYRKLNPHMFNNLEKNIPLHYINSFINTHKDIQISNRRLKELVLDRMIPKTIAEESISCYSKTLYLVHNKYDTLSVDTKTIQKLHFQLLNYRGSDSTKWRYESQSIPGIPQNIMYNSKHHPFPHELISQSMEHLCNQYNAINHKKTFHPLSLIARYMLNYYCIFPFSQGNHKAALILLQLLLLKNGYTFIKYVCLDKYTKMKEFEYRDCLYKSSANWYCNEHNISFWLRTFLDIILEAYKDLHNTVLESKYNYTKTEQIQNFIKKHKKTFTKNSIRIAYPDISESTINKTLSTLQLRGQIQLISKGRSARWTYIQT